MLVYWGIGIIGNTVALQVTVSGSIPLSSTNFYAVVDGEAPRMERRILDTHKGSTPLAAPSFVVVLARERHARAVSSKN